MVVVTLQREKCIGCNYCVELAWEYYRMSKKDGKSTLLGSRERRGFHTVKLEEEALVPNQNAAEACPVKIIKVKQV